MVHARFCFWRVGGLEECRSWAQDITTFGLVNVGDGCICVRGRTPDDFWCGVILPIAAAFAVVFLLLGRKRRVHAL
jgi:hypothetical protein